MGGIHAGIQAGHAAFKLALKYIDDPEMLSAVKDFDDNHETFVLLNGGEDESMQEVLNHLKSPLNPYAWQDFYEPGLNKEHPPLTAIAILLPERLYAGAGKPDNMWEVEFLKLKAARPLAS